MYTSIPNAYLWIVPNGDHVPILGERVRRFTQTAKEQPGTFCRLVTDFLDSL
jgi:hypothetical protein